MKALLQFVSLSLISPVALANERPLSAEMISETEMKAMQTQAMQQIEQELMKELPADLARHHQLINEHLFERQPLKNETVQQNDHNNDHNNDQHSGKRTCLTVHSKP